MQELKKFLMENFIFCDVYFLVRLQNSKYESIFIQLIFRLLKLNVQIFLFVVNGFFFIIAWSSVTRSFFLFSTFQYFDHVSQSIALSTIFAKANFTFSMTGRQPSDRKTCFSALLWNIKLVVAFCVCCNCFIRYFGMTANTKVNSTKN